LDGLQRRSEIDIEHIGQVSEFHLTERLRSNEPDIVHDPIDTPP
jgi:hypothetical protein